jgi:hypothetical protein
MVKAAQTHPDDLLQFFEDCLRAHERDTLTFVVKEM